MLRAACCVLRAACYDAACYVLRATCCVLRATCCVRSSQTKNLASNVTSHSGQMSPIADKPSPANHAARSNLLSLPFPSRPPLTGDSRRVKRRLIQRHGLGRQQILNHMGDNLAHGFRLSVVVNGPAHGLNIGQLRMLW